MTNDIHLFIYIFTRDNCCEKDANKQMNKQINEQVILGHSGLILQSGHAPTLPSLNHEEMHFQHGKTRIQVGPREQWQSRMCHRKWPLVLLALTPSSYQGSEREGGRRRGGTPAEPSSAIWDVGTPALGHQRRTELSIATRRPLRRETGRGGGRGGERSFTYLLEGLSRSTRRNERRCLTWLSGRPAERACTCTSFSAGFGVSCKNNILVKTGCYMLSREGGKEVQNAMRVCLQEGTRHAYFGKDSRNKPILDIQINQQM